MMATTVQNNENMNARIVSLSVILFACFAAFSSHAAQPGIPAQHGVDLMAQISDFRRFHSSREELEGRISGNKCFLDIRGLSVGRGPIPAQDVQCDLKLSVGSLLDKFSIDLKDLGGSQLRVFKRNEIIQRSRFLRTRSAEETARLKAIILEPGDVILFTAVE